MVCLRYDIKSTLKSVSSKLKSVSSKLKSVSGKLKSVSSKLAYCIQLTVCSMHIKTVFMSPICSHNFEIKQ